MRQDHSSTTISFPESVSIHILPVFLYLTAEAYLARLYISLALPKRLMCRLTPRQFRRPVARANFPTSSRPPFRTKNT